MTRPGRVGLFDREFDPSQEGLAVDIATLAQLRDRVGDDSLQRPGRVFFNLAIVCTAGEGVHEVDFTPVSLKPGRVVYVRPGQVHRWRLGLHYEATLLFFRGNHDLPGGSIGPRFYDLSDDEQDRSSHLIEIALGEYEIDRPVLSRDRALRGALQLLIVNLGLDRTSQGDISRQPKPYVALMAQFETGQCWSRSVTERAQRLGYSARTLSRACQAAVGKTAKEVIDDRILLEARRLLVHDANTVESVGRELSFSEASNFAKFFNRMTGENPETWRKRHKSD